MTNGLWDIGTASTLVKSLPAQLRFHQCFPSTSSIIAAGAVVGPVVDSFDGKDYSDSRKQDLIKRAIGRNHPAFPFPLDSLFGGWLVYDRKNPNKTPADPLILCTALSNFHHKYNPAQPTFLVRLPGKDLKFDDANTKAFDNPKHDYPMLGTTENISFLQHFAVLLSQLPPDLVSSPTKCKAHCEKEGLVYPVVLRQGQPPVDCNIKVSHIHNGDFLNWVNQLKSEGLLASFTPPPHITKRVHYPPGSQNQLYVGSFDECPAHIRDLCITSSLDYLLAHNQLPIMVTRELFLFSGFLVPQKNVTPQVVFKFLKVFEWEEEKDSEANEASDRRQYLEIDTYNLTPNQRIRVNLLLPASGTIRFTSQGYRFYQDYIAKNPRPASSYSRPAPCQALLETPAFEALRHARVRGTRYAILFHNPHILKLPRDEQDAWIAKELLRCGKTCMGKWCGMNKSAKLPIGLGQAYGSCTDPNLFLCFQDWTRSLVAWKGGVSAEDFQAELDISPKESKLGVCSVISRLGPFQQCVMGCPARYVASGERIDVKSTLGCTTLTCSGCSIRVQRQYDAIASEGSQLLADNPSFTRADLPPVQLKLDARHSEKCADCDRSFFATNGYNDDEQRLKIPYLNEAAESICRSCFLDGRVEVAGVRDADVDPFLARMVASPTLSTLNKLCRESVRPNTMNTPSLLLSALKSPAVRQRARQTLYQDFTIAVRDFMANLD